MCGAVLSACVSRSSACCTLLRTNESPIPPTILSSCLNLNSPLFPGLSRSYHRGRPCDARSAFTACPRLIRPISIYAFATHTFFCLYHASTYPHRRPQRGGSVRTRQGHPNGPPRWWRVHDSERCAMLGHRNGYCMRGGGPDSGDRSGPQIHSVLSVGWIYDAGVACCDC